MSSTHHETSVRQIVAGLFDAAALLDENNRPIVTNEAYQRLVGLNARRLQRSTESGTTTLELLRSSGPELAEGLETCRTTRRPVRLAEISATTQQGETVLVWVSFIPVSSSEGHLDAVLQVIRDVTAEARVQSHFKELLRESQGKADELERTVLQRTAELQSALDQVTHLSRTDPLTGALNRRAFDDLARHAVELARRHPERTVGILMCDLDHFKKLNDTFGHAAGDAMLVATAQVLARVVRTTDRVARFGGEEFVILLPEVNLEALSVVGERCCAAIRELPFAEIVAGKLEPQTVSIGGAITSHHGASLDALLRAADAALYLAKSQGRNRFERAA